MNSTTQNISQRSLKRDIGIGLYWTLGILIVPRIIKHFVAFDMATAISFILLSLISYPLFVRGTTMWWTKNKRPHTFQSFMAFNLGLAVLFLVICRIFFPEVGAGELDFP